MELGTVGASLGTCRPLWLLSSSEPAAIRFRPAREGAIAMTRKDRCSYRWKRLERKSTRRRRGGTTGSGLAAERGIGVQRAEAVPVPAQARDGSHRQSPSCQKTVGSEKFLPSAVVQRSCKILGAAADRTTNTARRPLCPNLQQ